jgi:hypothetical protein
MQKDEKSTHDRMDEATPSFSFNMNMLYPKNILTYSAYIKNIEGFIQNTHSVKKDVSISSCDIREMLVTGEISKKRSYKTSQTITGSNKKLSSGQSKSSVRPNKLNSDNNIDEENHPSLKRRYARLFISVPK